MATKKQNKTSDKQEGPGKIKPLKLKKQTVRDLTAEQSNQVKGGMSNPAESICPCDPRRLN
jgi:hypothetical protein